jgi:hypothetical protein
MGHLVKNGRRNVERSTLNGIFLVLSFPQEPPDLASMYSFRQILSYMESGREFTCKVVTYDRSRRDGGEVIEITGRLLRKDEDARHQGGRNLTKEERKRDSIYGLKRDPNHRRWYTRNIRLYSDGIPTIVIRKVHIPLIVEFQNEPVTP